SRPIFCTKRGSPQSVRTFGSCFTLAGGRLAAFVLTFFWCVPARREKALEWAGITFSRLPFCTAMSFRPEDLCPTPAASPFPNNPLAPPLYAASVYRCASPAEADRLLAGEVEGYVYQRDGHPNAAMLAEKCRQLHCADRAAVATSGMGALALATLALLKPGDHVVVSRLLYGKSRFLLTDEAARWGVT